MPLYSVMECSFPKCQKSLTLFSPRKRLPSLVLWLGSGNCLPRLNQGKNLEAKQLNCFLTLKQLSSLWSHLYSQVQVLGPPIPEILGCFAGNQGVLPFSLLAQDFSIHSSAKLFTVVHLLPTSTIQLPLSPFSFPLWLL